MINLVKAGKSDLKYEDPLFKTYIKECDNCGSKVEYRYKDIDYSTSFFGKITETRLNNCPWCNQKIILWKKEK